MSKEQLVAAFEAGDLGSVEFFELALEAGFGTEEIESILSSQEDEL
ncbi:hypothetical protein [Bradyrhizobium elkanii]|jgi:hypothetical protein|nr:hypothetical protein [Bradyrhizobium elkanii]MCP1932547.1 hypothetical protein [Bradyrhizobium elkanii]MCS3479526.1 hypothetical protein [Bradyrhizobium elkanii]MCS3576911.1 hypothetical protein [Bradyrhizobium elkanii]MCS3719788.1 hypothetical protein [Bradyrhizobium elkanii]MCS4004205.1 hypothetical protein [Bradyrhizobium elkanii USDA 61]